MTHDKEKKQILKLGGYDQRTGGMFSLFLLEKWLQQFIDNKKRLSFCRLIN